MLRSMAGIGVAVLLLTIGIPVPAEQEPEAEPEIVTSPVQVIRPELEVLGQPLVLEVQVDPSLGIDTSMRILCATSGYRGEISTDRQDVRIRLSIAGELRELSPTKILVSFEVEAQTEDTNGARGMAGSGAASIELGKPKTVLTIGGRSLILTIRLAD